MRRDAPGGWNSPSSLARDQGKVAGARNREFSGSVAGQPQNLVFEGSGLADFLEQLCGFFAVRASAALPAHRIGQCPWQRADRWPE